MHVLWQVSIVQHLYHLTLTTCTYILSKGNVLTSHNSLTAFRALLQIQAIHHGEPLPTEDEITNNPRVSACVCLLCACFACFSNYSPIYTRPQSGFNPPIDVDCPIRIGSGLIRIALRLYSIRKRVNPDSTRVQRIL